MLVETVGFVSDGSAKLLSGLFNHEVKILAPLLDSKRRLVGESRFHRAPFVDRTGLVGIVVVEVDLDTGDAFGQVAQFTSDGCVDAFGQHRAGVNIAEVNLNMHGMFPVGYGLLFLDFTVTFRPALSPDYWDTRNQLLVGHLFYSGLACPQPGSGQDERGGTGGSTFLPIRYNPAHAARWGRRGCQGGKGNRRKRRNRRLS